MPRKANITFSGASAGTLRKEMAGIQCRDFQPLLTLAVNPTQLTDRREVTYTGEEAESKIPWN